MIFELSVFPNKKYELRQRVGSSMHIASIPRNKHLLVSDSGGNISTINLNNLMVAAVE